MEEIKNQIKEINEKIEYIFSILARREIIGYYDKIPKCMGIVKIEPNTNYNVIVNLEFPEKIYDACFEDINGNYREYIVIDNEFIKDNIWKIKLRFGGCINIFLSLEKNKFIKDISKV